MAGYSRQSAADIIASAIIRAAPVNAEYNAIRDAFAFATGHKHDGSSTEGAYIPLIADTDAKNKVVVDTTNNRISVYSEVGGSAVEQLRIQDGAIVPVTDDDIDLGASGAEFKDLYIDGIGYIDTLAVHENATIAGTLNVTGVITAPGGLVADITGDIIGDVTGNVTGDLTGDVTSTGTSTFSDLDAVDLSATGTTVITSGDINSGTIDNSVIGAATPAAGTFTTLNANTSLTAATADINGGTIDGATIGATSHTTGKFTTLQSTGQATLNTVDINGGNIDGTVIGAVGTAAGSFTTLSTSGQATLATVNIDGGAIDGTTIGASSASTGAFTTVSASGGVTGDVTGNLTGNVTGNVTGDITGDVTGDLTGNVTSTGSSSFNNVTIDGTLNMNAGTTATITNLTSPTNTNDAATKGYVDTQVSNLVDSAPGTLDTLNELAAALGDDPDFATTVTNSIATKLPLAGGTMTGAIAMSTNKITGAGDPTAAQDVATKAYVDTQDGLQVTKSGDTMSGNLAMGSNKVTGLAAPTDANDATTKTYVDAILGSGSDAAASAAAAATSEANAATSETNASNSASAAATSEANAAASYDNFDDRYLGAKSTAPTVDNDGDALIVGALYFNNTTNIMNVYGSGGWQSAGSAVNGTSDRNTYTATSGQTVFAATYDTGYVDVYLNGVKLISGTDFTATNGTSITLTTGAAVNDVVDIVAYGTFVLADHYTSSQSDARYVEVAGDTMTGDLDVQGTITSDGLTVDGTTPAVSTLNSTSNGVRIEFNSASTPASRPWEVGVLNNADGDFQIYQAADVGAGDIKFYTDGTLRQNIDAQTGDISFYEDTGTTPKFFWDASAESLGLGATSFAGETLRMERSGDMILGLFSGASSSTFLNMGTTSNRDAGQIGYTQSSNHMFFRVNDAERMRIDSSGNVIVNANAGTSDAGTVRITGGTSGLSNLQFADTADGNIGMLQYNHASNHMLFQVNNSEAMRIDSSGNVGIGGNPTVLGGQNYVTVHSPGSSTNIAGYDLYVSGTREASLISYPNNSEALRIAGLTNRPVTFHANNSEVMRLTGEEVYIGHTGATAPWAMSGSQYGINLMGSGGFIGAARANAEPLILNRTGSDGAVLNFRKDGSTVGSIGAFTVGTSALFFGSLDTALLANSGNDSIHPWNASTNANRSDAIDLGNASNRFKDLYLSGGIQFDSRSNKLDDYEEGTFNPFSGVGSAYSNTSVRNAKYTKIGRMVSVDVRVGWTGTDGSGSDVSLTLPFTSGAATGTATSMTGAVFYQGSQLFSGAAIVTHISAGFNSFSFYRTSGSTFASVSRSSTNGTYDFVCSFVYYVA